MRPDKAEQQHEHDHTYADQRKLVLGEDTPDDPAETTMPPASPASVTRHPATPRPYLDVGEDRLLVGQVARERDHGSPKARRQLCGPRSHIADPRVQDGVQDVGEKRPYDRRHGGDDHGADEKRKVVVIAALKKASPMPG